MQVGGPLVPVGRARGRSRFLRPSGPDSQAPHQGLPGRVLLRRPDHSATACVFVFVGYRSTPDGDAWQSLGPSWARRPEAEETDPEEDLYVGSIFEEVLPELVRVKAPAASPQRPASQDFSKRAFFKSFVEGI